LPDSNPKEYFVERVANMSHANGVFRLTFTQQSDGDTLKPSVRLLIPANQLGSILQGINNAAKDIGEQVQARVGGGEASSDDDAELDDDKKKGKGKK